MGVCCFIHGTVHVHTILRLDVTIKKLTKKACLDQSVNTRIALRTIVTTNYHYGVRTIPTLRETPWGNTDAYSFTCSFVQNAHFIYIHKFIYIKHPLNYI